MTAIKLKTPIEHDGRTIEHIERVQGQLRHGRHAVLTMCADNAKTTSDQAMNRKLDKSKSTGRMNGSVSLTMAIGACSKWADD